MKAIWTGLFLLGFIFSVGCSMIRIPKSFATGTPRTGTLSIALATRSAIDEQAATPTFPMGLGTLQAFRTGFAETRTRAPTLTTTPTNTPSPTCTPPPVYFSPAATFPPRPNKTVTETLAADMLQILMAARPGHGAPKFSMIDDPFQIEMLDESIDADWDTERVSVNSDKTLTVFYSHAPGPEPSAEDLDELFKWRRARNWFVQDHEIGKTYRLKWQDNDLTGPSIDVESWVSKEVLVMSQFEYPRYSGFLVAIDVRAKKVLLVLQVEYGC